MLHYLYYSATINESKEKFLAAFQAQETLLHYHVLLIFL